MNITNDNGITGIVHRIPLALFLSYVMACAAYFSDKSWVKTILYAFSVALLATDTFLHNVFHIYIQPFMVMLIGETNHQEAGEFFGTFVLSRGGLITLFVIVTSSALIIMAERFRSKVSQYILSRHAKHDKGARTASPVCLHQRSITNRKHEHIHEKHA